MPKTIHGKPVDEVKWDKAKKLAAEQGHTDDYDYVMSIYLKMTEALNMENKELLKHYIEALEDNNKLMKKEQEDEDKEEAMDEEPEVEGLKKEEETEDTKKESEDEEEPKQMEKLIKVVESLAKKIEALEDEDKKEQDEEDTIEEAEEEKPEDKKEADEEETEKEAAETDGVDAADDVGATKDGQVQKDDDPNDIADKQTKGAKEDNITKNESAEEDKTPEESVDDAKDDKKTEAEEDEDDKSEAEDEESEDKPKPPVTEGINKVRIERSFKPGRLSNAVKKLL